MYFWYKENVLELYFHSATEGRKLDVLKRNNKVCFEISYEGEPVLFHQKNLYHKLGIQSKAELFARFKTSF